MAQRGRPAHFKYVFFQYGYDGMPRLEVELQVPISSELRGSVDDIRELMEYWSHISFEDRKHSGPWTCWHCGKIARENIVTTTMHPELPAKGLPASDGLPLPGPSMYIYSNALCSTQDANECYQLIRAATSLPRVLSNAKGADLPAVAPVDDTIWPMNAACAGCQTDASAAKVTSRCIGCCLTHYCSPACQRKDWHRHRDVCKAVRLVQVYHSDGKEDNTTPVIRKTDGRPVKPL